MKFLNSFYYAARGVGKAFLRERNLRIHFCAANLVCIFAVEYGLDRMGWTALIITFVIVFAAELLNTAVEAAVDTATQSYSFRAEFAKDVAAGAVLVTAVGAVAVGILLFGDIDRIVRTLKLITGDMVNLVLFFLLLIADYLFVFKIKNIN